jgi:hypothetical protein
MMQNNTIDPYVLRDPTCHDLRASGHLIKTIFLIFPLIFPFISTKSTLRYFPVIIPKSAHPSPHPYLICPARSAESATRLQGEKLSNHVISSSIIWHALHWHGQTAFYTPTNSVADPDPGSGAFLPPGSGIRIRDAFIPDPGSDILDSKL